MKQVAMTQTPIKITAIRAVPVRVPRPQPFTSSLGLQSGSENAVVLIETDKGVTGLGEISSIWDRKGRGQAEDVNDLLADALVGMDPFCPNLVSARMDELLHRSYPAKAGIEMALYDIMGKVLGAPVYDLLGGRVHERIALSRSLSMGEPEAVVAQAEALAAEGYKTLKLKVGRDADADYRTLEALRRRLGPDMTLRVDANMGWASAKEAVRQIRRLEEFGLELVEQPLHAADLEGLRFVRQRVETPIMADESIWTPTDAMACIRAEAVDVFNVYVAEAGGLGAAGRVFAIAEAARLPCIIGSMPELGIGTAAQAHLAFAVSGLGYACDLNGFSYHSDDVVHHSLRLEAGYIYPPPGPGLGVELDEERLDRYRIDR
jgi:L-alanine-DL-glutamate epimerase-like enolase superfamily enzyme